MKGTEKSTKRGRWSKLDLQLSQSLSTSTIGKLSETALHHLSFLIQSNQVEERQKLRNDQEGFREEQEKRERRRRREEKNRKRRYLPAPQIHVIRVADTWITIHKHILMDCIFALQTQIWQRKGLHREWI